MDLEKMPPPGRYAPEIPFPSYTFVPGRQPHPTHSPEGHSFGVEPDDPEPPELDRWRDSPLYLHGVDLFNYGYYWEAHEAWEGLWHACGHIGRRADFLKGLIKLAAAGVKVREGQMHGVQAHAHGALELFDHVYRLWGQDRFMGLSLLDLMNFARELAAHPFVKSVPDEEISPVFDFYLRLK